jgi:hypothetical protein
MKISRTRRRSAFALAALALLWGGFGLVAEGRERAATSFEERLLRGPGRSNHPVGVIPSPFIRIPEGWPLDADGSITCRTCHERLPSAEDPSHPGLRDHDPAFDMPKAFCMKCHDSTGNRTASGLHWMAVGQAHYGTVDYEGAGSRPRASGRGLDSVSAQCLACHDGVTARDPVNPTSSEGGGFDLFDQHRNHPVGIPNWKGWRKHSGVSYRLPPLVSEEVRLPEGKVSCVSCHDLYSNLADKLAVPIERSMLCLTCHVM